MSEQQADGTQVTAIIVALVADVIVTVAGVAFVSPGLAIQVIGFGTMVAVGLFNSLQGVKAKAEVQQVAATLEQTKMVASAERAETLKGVQAIHTLVNSNMGAQLKVSAVALRRVAEYSSHPDDVAAADMAERQLRDHEAKQATVDASK